MTDSPLKNYRDTMIIPDAETRCLRLFLTLLDTGIMIGSNGLGCLTTPMGKEELDKIAAAFERALFILDSE